MTHRRGITRAESAVMIAIVVFIAMFALPNIRNARLNSNEELARTMLGRIAAANSLYYRDYQVYAPDLSFLYAGEYLVDRGLEQAHVSLSTPYEGYFYVYRVDAKAHHFLAFAMPSDYRGSGIYSYVINELDDIHRRDIHDGQDMSRMVMIERFVEYDFSVAEQLSPWKTTSKGVVLGRLEDRLWLPLNLELDED